MNWSIDLEEQYDKIYRYCYYRLRSREAAEDVTQEAFLRFLGLADAAPARGEEDCGRGYGPAYLYTIARNLCMDEFRRRKRTVSSGAEGWAEQIADADQAEKVLEQIALENALSKLSGEERELILLRYANEEPFAVICEIFAISRFTAHRRLKRALTKLRESMR